MPGTGTSGLGGASLSGAWNGLKNFAFGTTPQAYTPQYGTTGGTNNAFIGTSAAGVNSNMTIDPSGNATPWALKNMTSQEINSAMAKGTNSYGQMNNQTGLEKTLNMTGQIGNIVSGIQDYGFKKDQMKMYKEDRADRIALRKKLEKDSRALGATLV